MKLEKKDGYSEDAKQCDFLPDPNTLRLLALPFSLLKALLHAEERRREFIFVLTFVFLISILCFFLVQSVSRT